MPDKKEERWQELCTGYDTCALTGAAAFIAGIPGAEIVANGPLWCYFYALGYLERSDYRLAERFHASQPENQAVIYGSEKYLLQTLRRLMSGKWQPELLLIENSCSMSMIGDDLAGIAHKAKLPCPVLTLDCGGMLGGFAAGYSAAAVKVAEQFASDTEQPQPSAVNLLGMTDFYLHGAADRQECCRLLQAAGYRVLAVPGSGAALAELRQLGRAQLNVVVNEELGLALAQYLQRRFGTPYVLAGLPYGVEGTLQWLRRIDAALPAAHPDAVAAEAAATQRLLTHWVNAAHCLWGSLWFDAAVVCAPPVVALCLAQALRSEWADLGRLIVFCRQRLPESAASAYCTLADDVRSAAAAGIELEQAAAGVQRLLLLASSNESALLCREGQAACLNCNIAFPVNDELLLAQQPYAGLAGSKILLQTLWNAYIRQALAHNA